MNVEQASKRGNAEADLPQVLEAPAEASSERKVLEERLKHHATCEGGQLLMLETDLWQSAGLRVDLGLAMLHRNGSFSGEIVVWRLNNARAEAVVSFLTDSLSGLRRSRKV